MVITAHRSFLSKMFKHLWGKNQIILVALKVQINLGKLNLVEEQQKTNCVYLYLTEIMGWGE